MPSVYLACWAFLYTALKSSSHRHLKTIVDAGSEHPPLWFLMREGLSFDRFRQSCGNDSKHPDTVFLFPTFYPFSTITAGLSGFLDFVHLLFAKKAHFKTTVNCGRFRVERFAIPCSPRPIVHYDCVTGLPCTGGYPIPKAQSVKRNR